jgi:hypothetical protein
LYACGPSRRALGLTTVCVFEFPQPHAVVPEAELEASMITAISFNGRALTRRSDTPFKMKILTY